MIRHVSSIAEIVADVEGAVRFYRDVLGLEVDYDSGSAYATIKVAGTLHFGLWARSAAAESVFGDASAADRIPLGFTVGFEVDRVESAQHRIEARGWPILQPIRQEGWGQTTCRFLTPGGGLGEVAETPSARQIAEPMRVEQESM